MYCVRGQHAPLNKEDSFFDTREQAEQYILEAMRWLHQSCIENAFDMLVVWNKDQVLSLQGFSLYFSPLMLSLHSLSQGESGYRFSQSTPLVDRDFYWAREIPDKFTRMWEYHVDCFWAYRTDLEDCWKHGFTMGSHVYIFEVKLV